MSALGLSWKAQQSPKEHRKNSFQQELRQKLKQRHSMGITIDVSSDEEDQINNEKDDTTQSTDNLLAQFFPHLDVTSGPEGRQSPLGQTLRRLSGNSQTIQSSVSKATDKRQLSFLKDRTSTRSDDVHFADNKQKLKDTMKDRPLTKEEIIFGQKDDSMLQLGDSKEKKVWTPPTFKQSAVESVETTPRLTSPGSSRGRRTPSIEPNLTSISETPIPASRSRSQNYGDTESHTHASIEDMFSNLEKSSAGKPSWSSPLAGETSISGERDKKGEGCISQSTTHSVTPRPRKTKSRSPTPKQTPTRNLTDNRSMQLEQDKITKVPDVSSGTVNTEPRGTPSFLELLTEEAKRPQVRPRKRSSIDKLSSGSPHPDTHPDTHPKEYHSNESTDLDLKAEKSSICDELEQEPSKPDQKTITTTITNQTTEHQEAANAINAVTSCQHDQTYTMKYINPAHTDNVQQPKPFRSPRCKPKPRYQFLPGNEQPLKETSFEDSQSIRTAVYAAWLQERDKQIKEKLRDQRKAQNALQEKTKKEKEEKLSEAKGSYEAWLKVKNKQLREHLRDEARKKDESEKKNEEEKENKVKEGKSSYNNWKAQKDNQMKEKLKKEKYNTIKKDTDERSEKLERSKKADEQYQSWKSEKDEEIRTKLIEEKDKQKTAEDQTNTDRHKRERLARKQYAEWLIKKEVRDRQTRDQLKKNKFHSMDSIPPWSPAG